VRCSAGLHIIVYLLKRGGRVSQTTYGMYYWVVGILLRNFEHLQRWCREFELFYDVTLQGQTFEE